MAEQLVTKLSESFDSFKCQFCLERFEDPRVSACQHSVCTRCAERLIKKLKVDEKYEIKCPTCASITEISKGQGQESILINLRSEVVLRKDTETKNSTIPCDDCISDDPAVVRCITCCLYLCEICSQGHKRRKSTSNHKLVTLEELQSSGPSVLPISDLCHQHEGEEIRLYCETCEKTICRECAIVDHRDHEYHFVKDVYSKEKEAVTQLLEETKTKQTLLRDAVKGVIEMRACVQEAGTAVTEQINATVDGFIQTVETCRKTFLQQARDIEQGKLKRLEIQKEELETALSSVTSNIEFTEKALRDGSQVKVLVLKKHMMDRLHELNHELQELEPCTDPIISYYSKLENNQDVLNALGRVSDSRIEPTKCEVKTDDELDALEVWKEITLSVFVNDQHGRAMFKPAADVSVVIKSPNNHDRTQKVEVTNKADGRYHGLYIPCVPGIHRVFVTVSGAEIPGCPFELNVIGSVNPYLTTLQMEAGKSGVVYNTLINQTRDFIVVTRDSKGEQIRDDGALINVEIKEPNNLDAKVVPVQDCEDGRYTFNYKPLCVGNYQVSVKVDGNNIRGSPFTWGVEQWHLVARNRKDSRLIFSQSNMTVEWRREIGWFFGIDAVVGSCGFTGGCHSWKVEIVSGGMWCSVGMTDCNVEPVHEENRWCWVDGSKCHVYNGSYTDGNPSNISVFNPNDIVLLYLDNDTTLTLHHLASGKTDTFNLGNTTLYPYFNLVNSKLTLLV